MNNHMEPWFKQELNNIKNTIKTSEEEAKNILDQRLREIAQNNGITQEEAATVYKQIRQNTKTI